MREKTFAQASYEPTRADHWKQVYGIAFTCI